jgi:hypothetical protein
MHGDGGDGDVWLILQNHPLWLLNSHSVYLRYLIRLYGDHVHHDGDGDFCLRVNHLRLNPRLQLLVRPFLQDAQLFLQLVQLETLERE